MQDRDDIPAGGWRGLLDDIQQAGRRIFGEQAVDDTTDAAARVVNSTVDQIKGFGGDKLQAAVGAFNDALPYIERAGYRVIEIDAVIGVAPSIVPRLAYVERVDDETRAALLEETRGKTLTINILKSLFKATDMQEKLKFRRFGFAEIELEVGLLPGITMRFRSAGVDERALRALSDGTPKAPPADVGDKPSEL